jgi:hypothetical protein
MRVFLESDETKAAFERLGIDVPLQASRTAHSRNNTDRAYLYDQIRFLANCAPSGNLSGVTQEHSLEYFRALGTEELPTGRRRGASVVRAMFAVRKLYWERGLPSPTMLMSHRQLARELLASDTRQTHKAKPLYGTDAVTLVDSFDQSTLPGLRGGAICSIGVNRGLRASTITGLDVERTLIEARGIVLEIQFDKTHRSGSPLRTATKHSAEHRACAACRVGAYIAALETLGIREGPLFRPIDRWGHLQPTRLHPAAVTDILRAGLRHAAIPDADSYSSHSFRHGVVHAGILAGWSIEDICAVTLHRSRRGILPYVMAIDPWLLSPKDVPLSLVNRATVPRNIGWVHA